MLHTVQFPCTLPKSDAGAFSLLTRDIENVCHAVARHGLVYDGRRIAERPWNQFRTAQL